jgi:hypothetical protein
VTAINDQMNADWKGSRWDTPWATAIANADHTHAYFGCEHNADAVIDFVSECTGETLIDLCAREIVAKAEAAGFTLEPIGVYCIGVYDQRN